MPVLDNMDIWPLRVLRYFIFNISLNRVPFCGVTGPLYFGLRMTPPIDFKARVDPSSPMPLRCLHVMILRVISD